MFDVKVLGCEGSGFRVLVWECTCRGLVGNMGIHYIGNILPYALLTPGKVKGLGVRVP